ncbi:MAG: hypothetical protein EOO10_25320, partial [Chitinophagaceae bacterium]
MSDAVRKNAIPTLASLMLHLGLLGGIYYWETHQDPPPKVVEVQVIEAKLVSLKTKTKVAHTEDTRKINKVEVSQAVEKEQDIKNKQEQEQKAAAEKLADETQKKAQQQEVQRKEQEAKVEEPVNYNTLKVDEETGEITNWDMAMTEKQPEPIEEEATGNLDMADENAYEEEEEEEETPEDLPEMVLTEPYVA